MWAVSGKWFNCTTLDGIAFDGGTAFSATARRVLTELLCRSDRIAPNVTGFRMVEATRRQARTAPGAHTVADARDERAQHRRWCWRR